MKKIFLVAVVFTCINFNTKACDVCGGTINSSTGEIIPGLYSHFIGLRSNFQSFDSEHLTLFSGESPILSKEWFHNTELFGRYTPHKRVQIMGFLPYNVVYKHEENEVLTSQGFGDARVFGNFLILDRKNNLSDFEINWFGGLHIKFPTGRFNFKPQEEVHFHPNMLPGTGSWDFGLQSDLILSKNGHGAMITGNYFLRGENSRQYLFGNLTSARAVYFYKKQREKFSFMIEAGLNYANLAPDIDLRWNEEQTFSQGNILSPTLRLSTFYKKWVTQISANRAVYQDLAKGQTFQNYEVNLSIIRFI